MSTTLTRFKHRKDYAKGQFVSGPSGRRYYVDPATTELHLVSRKGGNVSDRPGVTEQDAEEFSQFGKLFRLVTATAVAPPPPPKKAAPPPPPKKVEEPEPEVEEASADKLSASEGGEGSPDRSESPSLADSLPNDNNYLTIKEWLDLARANGIALSKREKATRPKSDLIDLIREKAVDLPPKIAETD